MAKTAEEVKNERDQKESSNSLRELSESLRAWTSTIASETGGALKSGITGVGSGAKDAAKAAVDALVNELPGAAFLRSSMSDMKGYFSGLREKAKEKKERAEEIKRQKQEAKNDEKQSEDTTNIDENIKKQVDIGESTQAQLAEAHNISLDVETKQYELLESIEGQLRESNDLDKERAEREKLQAMKDKGDAPETIHPSTIDPKVNEKETSGFFGGLFTGSLGKGGFGAILKKVLNPARLLWPLALLSIAGLFKDEIMNFVSGDGIVKAFSFIVDGIKKMTSNLISWVSSANFSVNVLGFVTDIVDVFLAIVKGIGKVIWMSIQSIFGKSAEEAAAEADQFFSSLGSSIKNIFSFLKDSFSAVVDGIQNAIMGVKRFIVSTYNSFVGAIPGNFIPKLKIDNDGNISKVTDKDKGDALLAKAVAEGKPLKENVDLSSTLDTTGVDYANEINRIQSDPTLSDEVKQSAIIAAMNKFQGTPTTPPPINKVENVVKPATINEEKQVQQVRQNLEVDVMTMWKKINDEERLARKQNNVTVSSPQSNVVNYVQQADTSRRNR